MHGPTAEGAGEAGEGPTPRGRGPRLAREDPPGRRHPALAPGAPEEFARIVEQVRANPIGPKKRKRNAQDRKAYAAAWREDIKSSGGFVTNVAFSRAAWQRVKDVQGGSTTRGASSKAISDLFERSIVVDERTMEEASKILEAYPDMGTPDEVIRVAVGHLLWKINHDDRYTITTC